MTDLERLIGKEAVSIEVKSSAVSPMFPGMINFEIVLKYHGRKLQTPFLATPGYNPTVADVLSSLCREARGYDETNGDFNAWCVRFQHNSDSRAIYAAWEGIRKTSPKLKAFLGRKWKLFLDAKH